MTSCCTTQASKATCLVCAKTSISVHKATLLQGIVFPLNMDVEDQQYFYCGDVDCDIGYFTEAGTTVNKKDLRAYDQIEAGWLCYCFGISRSAYKAELMAGGAELIKSFVIEQTRQGACACEIRNPSGRCCLADFKRLEKQHESN